MSRMKKVALAIGFVLVVGSVGAAVGASTSRSGPITKFSGVDEIVHHCSSSTTFKNIPQATKAFTQGGAGSVAVMFTGSFSMGNASPFDTAFLRLTIDGVVQTPGTVPFLEPDSRGSHGFNWQTSSLSAGVHTARIAMRTDVGSEVCVDARSTLVLHR